MPARPLPYAPLLELVDTGSEEERYFALLALARHDSVVVRARLRSFLDHEHALTRNAAARALVDLGEEDAAATLIANLHRDQRTYVVTDAIFHLRALFDTDLGYEPNRGYRHQSERQEAWWAYFERRGYVRSPEATAPDEHQKARETLRESLLGFENADYEGDDARWKAAAKLWQEAGEIASSRHLPDVAAVADVFELLATYYPDHVSIQNNAALSALNDGRWEAAARRYARVIELEAADAGLHNDHGILLEALGRLTDAEAAYRRAAELAPEDDIAWANLGDVLRKQGRATEAQAAYGTAEGLAPDKWYYHRLWQTRLGAIRSRPRPRR